MERFCVLLGALLLLSGCAASEEQTWTLVGNTYENTAGGFGCSLEEGWVWVDPEETGLSMLAENRETFSSIAVEQRPLSLWERFPGQTSEEALPFPRELPAEAVEREWVYVTFLGQPCTALHTAARVEGVDYYLLQLFPACAGGCRITLTLASFLEDRTDAMLGLFYPLE